MSLFLIHFQYCDIMRFTVLHNGHHKVSRSSCIAKPLTTILLRIRVRGHFVMSITKNHESHMSQYWTLNPLISISCTLFPQ